MPVGTADRISPTSLGSRLVYFPEPLPEEIIYSVIARYIRHVGTPGRDAVNADLFGIRLKRPNITFSSGLGFLASKLPKDFGPDARTMLFRHTVFPYYAAFMPVAQREAAIATRVAIGPRAVGSSHGWQRLTTDRSLRFCPECLMEMKARYGEFYWRRDHQIPTVLVCPVHRSVLRLASTSAVPKWQFCPATQSTCPSQASLVVEEVTEVEMDALHAIATRSASLLEEGAVMISKATDPKGFRRLMQSKSLLNGTCRTRRDTLQDKMLKHFGHLARVWPDIFGDTGVRGSDALNRIAGSGSEITDPVIYVMLHLMMDQLPDAPPPFGFGPWHCPNPLGRHTDALPVKNIVLQISGSKVIGRFTCQCGYEYARSIMKDGRVTKPVIKRFGPSLLPLLKKAESEGWNIRRTAAAAGIEPITLYGHARAIGQGHIWKKVHRRQQPLGSKPNQ